MALLLVALCAIGILPAEGFFEYPQPSLGEIEGDDAGQPLFLTPFVESGNIMEGRSKAKVPLTEEHHIKSYAGFFTVNKTYDSNQFFWYFPAMENHEEAPVVVWLQGGPGGSSLFGLFSENGPIQVRHGRFKRRKHHWAKNHHLIYIDNPVGTGFSFTKSEEGYCTDETQIGEQLYSTVIQFFKLFPELLGNKFFVTGESYAGKYVPALAYTIHKKNPTAALKINLEGIAIGDGFSDPENQLSYGPYLEQLGLIDKHVEKQLKEKEIITKQFIKEQKWKQAFNEWNLLVDTFSLACGVNNYNYVYQNDYEDYGPMLQKSYVRKAIHVGELPYNNGFKVLAYLKLDFMQSVAPLVSELLDHYHVLTYNGQLDIIVAYPLTVNYLRQLNFTGAEEYKSAERHQWKVDNEVAGCVKTAGRLVEVLVRNAGHMVPADQPLWAWDLITRFTHGTKFYDDETD